MGVELSILEPGHAAVVSQFATGSGVVAFVDWAMSLPDDDYPDLRHFAEHGWVEGLDVLAEQVRHGLDDFPPNDPDIASVAMGLESALDGRNPDGIALLGDAGEDDEDDEDELGE